MFPGHCSKFYKENLTTLLFPRYWLTKELFKKIGIPGGKGVKKDIGEKKASYICQPKVRKLPKSM